MCMHVYLFYELNKIIFVFNNRKCIFLGRPAAGIATKRDQNLTNPGVSPFPHPFMSSFWLD